MPNEARYAADRAEKLLELPRKVCPTCERTFGLTRKFDKHVARNKCTAPE